MSTQYTGAGSFELDAALSAYRGVTLNSDNEMAASSSATRPDAITQEDGDTGEYIACKFMYGAGTQKISITGCPVTIGDLIYAGAAGQATRTGNAIVIGRSRTTVAAAGNGTIIEFIPMATPTV